MGFDAKPERPSFAAVIDQRFRLGGKAIIEKGHPYFVPVDRLEKMYQTKPNGFVNLAHYDYLGLAKHPRVRSAAVEAINEFGPGVGASRLVGGERLAHQALERNLADFLGHGDVLSMISGYLTNLSLINHLLWPRDLVLIDELAHNSIVVGANSGKFDCKTFRHNDLDDLEEKLTAHRNDYRNVLIVVEGLYSMDGDIPDLPRLVEIKNRHQVWLLVDEAHSFGVLGKTGRGACEHFDIDPSEIELSVGTLSKSFVSSGGFICASADVIAWLRFSLPGFVYSVGLGPATVASANAALDILKEEPERVARLKQKSHLFLEAARAAGLNTGDAIGEAVVPLLFDNPLQTMMVSQVLLDAGIYAPPIVQVGVPKDQPRIRFFFSAEHRDEDILRAVDVAASAVHGGAQNSDGLVLSKMQGFFGLLLAASLALTAPVDAASLQSLKVTETAQLARARPDYPIPAEPNQLFYLQRSTNPNTVIYTARFDANGNLDPRRPVAVYWRRYNDAGERKPLKRIEQMFAYGVSVAKHKTAGEFTVTLKPAGQFPILLRQTGPGKAEALTTVSGRTVRLAYIYLTVDESGLVPRVTGLAGYGIDIQSGRAIAQTFAVSGGVIRP